MAITVIIERCPQNHPCPALAVCPVDALSQQGMAAPVLDSELCIDCGKCSDVCPTGALQPEVK